jgi:hypothetical protein
MFNFRNRAHEAFARYARAAEENRDVSKRRVEAKAEETASTCDLQRVIDDVIHLLEPGKGGPDDGRE